MEKNNLEVKNDNKEEKQPNTEQNSEKTIIDHSETQIQEDKFNNFCSESLRIGAFIVANKSHGKTKLMQVLASKLIEQPNTRTLIFDGSLAWVYSFSTLPYFTIKERDLLETNRRNANTIEKFEFQNWNLIKLALETYPNILFKIDTRQPNRRGFIIRTIINHCDQLQRTEKENSATHENTKAFAFLIEESQNVFSSFGNSTASQECGSFMTAFSEGRNNKLGFVFSAQRRNDFSKTLRSKCLTCLGALNMEDVTPELRRLEKLHGIDFSEMKAKTWLYNDELFTSPTFSQKGKPFEINAEIKKLWLDSLPKPKSLKQKILTWLLTPRNQNQKANLDDSEPKSVYNESEGMDEEIEDDGIIEDELGL
jgi:hypothetical protein